MMLLRRGKAIGPFIVEKELSSGGMATVYQARLPGLRGHPARHVAIKVARDGYEDFLRNEEEHLRHLHHPHIIRPIPIPTQTEGPRQKVYIRRTTTGESPLWYVVLEQLKGNSLADLLRFKKRLPTPVAVEIARQVGTALEYLHRARGVAHLDVRPDNILFRHDPLNANWRPEAVLCDFGITWRNEKVPTDSYGDLPYVAPERRWGEPVAFTCDVYSLGVVLYEMLVGVRPYPQDEDVEMAAAPTINVDPPVPPSKHNRCSPQGDAVILRAIARRPEDRYPTVSAFLEELAPVELVAKSHLARHRCDWKQFLKWSLGLMLIFLLSIVSYLAGLSSWEVFPPSSPRPIAFVTRVVTAVPSFTIEATSTAVLATPIPTTPHSLLPPTPTHTSTPWPTSTLIPTRGTAGATRVPESAILYAEDFENGVATGWTTYVGTWSVEKEKDGNRFWCGRGPDNYPQAWWNTDDPRWTDYAFESRMRFVQGSIFVCARADNGGAFYNAYISSNDDWVSFADFDGTQYQTFGDTACDISPDKWYEVRFEVKGDTLKLYIDNNLITQARRSSRKQGGIGYYMGGGDEIHIDDIRVWALEP